MRSPPRSLRVRRVAAQPVLPRHNRVARHQRVHRAVRRAVVAVAAALPRTPQRQLPATCAQAPRVPLDCSSPILRTTAVKVILRRPARYRQIRLRRQAPSRFRVEISSLPPALGQPTSFDALAREAKVSRSWLYAQPDLRAEIDRLRASWDPAPVRERLPHRQRASDASLRQRLQVMSERNRQLETENRQLREALAVALGEQRTASIVGRPGDTPGKKSQPVIRPC